MLRTTTIQYFKDYSDEAIEQVLATCEGKPVYASDAKYVIGNIVSGEPLPDKGVRFTIEMEALR